MSSGVQEVLALVIVALIATAIVLRRLRARRRKKPSNEASVPADGIGRRR